ncbi:MAG: type II toxin-antitoxin system Phd/YefM family antitoxin [Proteobacteria bacterium]|nr:type II toxin-antitoxin system Phd/YefM family antitoxin [Pseudomonadota bacterium]
MKSQLSISQVKNQLPAIIHEIEKGQMVHVTRHGKSVAVLLSVDEYDRLIGKKDDFWENYLTFRHHVKEKNLMIDDSVFEDVRDHSPGRDLKLD